MRLRSRNWIHSQAGISDSELLKLLVFCTLGVSAVYLVGGWIYEVKEGRLERDREMRGHASERWNAADSHEVEQRGFSLDFRR